MPSLGWRPKGREVFEESLKPKTGFIRRVKMKCLKGSLAAVMLIVFIVVGVFASAGFCQPAQSAAGGPSDLATAIVEVAKACLPAVVHIEVTERREIPNPLLPYENDPFFRHFFGVPKKMPKKFK